MMLRNCLPAGQTTGELTGAQVALQAAVGTQLRGQKGAPLPGGILEVAVCDALWGENAEKSVAAGPSNRRSCDLHEKSHGGGAVFSFVRRTV